MIHDNVNYDDLELSERQITRFDKLAEYPILRGIAEYIDEHVEFVHLVIQGISKHTLGGQGTEFLPPDYYRIDIMSLEEREVFVGQITITDDRVVFIVSDGCIGDQSMFQAKKFELSDPMCFEQLTESVIKHCETRAYITVRKCQPKTN